MARGRKKYKKRVTYDSGETKTAIGLIFLFLGILTLLSNFIEGPVFLFLKNLVSGATLLLAIFFFNVSLLIFKSKFPLAQKKSVMAQFIFVLTYSAFINSVFGGGYSLESGEEAKYGGIIGYHVYSFLNENVFLNFTPVFLFIVIILTLPLSLSMTISAFLDMIGNSIHKIISLVKRDKKRKESDFVDVELIEPETIGDFQKLSSRDSVKNEAEDSKKDIKEPDTSRNVSDIAKKKIEQPKVQIKKESVEGAYLNEELQYPRWKFPGLKLLNPVKKVVQSKRHINRNSDIIEQTLKSFGVKAKVEDVLVGPTVTQYALDIALGTKVSKISNLRNDLALALAAPSNAIRIEAPIAGTSYVGIEIPNLTRATVYSKTVLSDLDPSAKPILPLGLGVNNKGEVVILDLQKMPHILVAGATGSGKSVLTNGFIISLLMTKTPDEVRFIMVDPKQVELSDYNGIPNLITPVITEMEKVLNALKWAIAEMEKRYTIFREAKVRNIEGYNKVMGYAALPYIIIVIDELADMMMSANKAEIESAIVRLAQKARATGIHLVLATQRPSVDVITGLIKANIPARVGMSVTTQIDSRVILDQIGAESLLGNGDLLYKDPSFGKPVRVQGMWMAADEIQRIAKFIKEQVEEVSYTKEVTEKKESTDDSVKHEGASFSSDNQFANAARLVVSAQKGSASLLQRKLSIGYNRAARLLDELEEHGVVGPPKGSKPRDVLISDVEGFLSARDPKDEEPEEEQRNDF